jgi:hypothetical protein
MSSFVVDATDHNIWDRKILAPGWSAWPTFKNRIRDSFFLTVHDVSPGGITFGAGVALGRSCSPAEEPVLEGKWLPGFSQ